MFIDVTIVACIPLTEETRRDEKETLSRVDRHRTYGETFEKNCTSNKLSRRRCSTKRKILFGTGEENVFFVSRINVSIPSKQRLIGMNDFRSMRSDRCPTRLLFDGFGAKDSNGNVQRMIFRLEFRTRNVHRCSTDRIASIDETLPTTSFVELRFHTHFSLRLACSLDRRSKKMFFRNESKTPFLLHRLVFSLDRLEQREKTNHSVTCLIDRIDRDQVKAPHCDVR